MCVKKGKAPWSSRLFWWTGLDGTEFELSDDVSPYLSLPVSRNQTTGEHKVVGHSEVVIHVCVMYLEMHGW